MVAAAFVAPYLLEATARFVQVAAALPGVRLGLITSTPLEQVAPDLRGQLAGHWRVDNALDPRQIAEGVSGLAGQMGRVERLVGALEQLQVPLAQVREAMGIEGMDVDTALNVRDKPRMKDVLRAAGVPCARHALVHDAGQARHFAAEVGFPLVAKPPAGAGSQATYRLDDRVALRRLARRRPAERRRPGAARGVPRRGGAHVRQRHDGRHDGLVVDRRLHRRRRWRCCATRGSSGRCCFPATSPVPSTPASTRSVPPRSARSAYGTR